MSASTYRIVVVDDEKGYREQLAKKLSDRTMKGIAIAPPSTPLADAVLTYNPDAVLVDYQLTQPQPGSATPPASYLGSLLIAALRERLPATAIILLTRRKLASAGGALKGAAELDEVFDDLLFKEDVEARPVRLRTELRSLIRGYKTLELGLGTWPSVVEALAAPEYAKDELRQYGSPAGTLKGEGFRPSAVARWIRRTVLQYPGALVDDLHSATDIGLSLASFRKAGVSKWFASAKYRGVFSEDRNRWWRGALRARAQAITASRVEDVGEVLPAFVRAWNEAHPKDRATPAKCCVCALPTSDAVCEVLKRPVMLRCSVPYFPDARPPGFDGARISFKAIRETTLNDDMFASNVLPLVREIESSDGP